jgi:hypothetical protein
MIQKRVESCTKTFIDKYKFKNKQELYKIDFDILKSIIFDCADMVKTLDDKMKNNNYDTYIIYDEYEENEFLDLNNNVIGYEKIPKKIIKKSSKKSFKKTTKKTSKKASRKTTKKH